ncbi:hypothetical protein OFC13_30235, partial [Escherichia coli]|nr:hypothetical protein [Escherichia coli]
MKEGNKDTYAMVGFTSTTYHNERNEEKTTPRFSGIRAQLAQTESLKGTRCLFLLRFVVLYAFKSFVRI